ncbi:hypothetical protein FNU76_17475 [Chitinimonas arctica]|uniref:Phytanoyl-CoA dioxygenase family protein n=1 Tax=Chitinimonas arctica TaxID=2594795 RepID=A0A516SIL9_9NEIS|nr:hypothetical protein [Chitinimonas arctica]QDQ27992.1 hypothetical protein FNU76_17475 [Chitinimonas arctica]
MTLSAPIDEFFLPIGDAASCRDWHEQLLDLEAFWISRHSRLPFFTLGATNYYDLSANPAKPYERLARQYNPLLRSCFGGLYERLRAQLQARLGQPVGWLADNQIAALPGFHLFQGHAAFAGGGEVTHAQWFRQRDGAAFPGNPVHTDTAHLALGLSGATLSFTLPIVLPEAGAGLRCWPVAAADTARLGDAALLARLADSPPREIRYQVGQMLVHSGETYHQARGLPCRAGEQRMTLQGHGVLRDGAWQLFW